MVKMFFMDWDFFTIVFQRHFLFLEMGFDEKGSSKDFTFWGAFFDRSFFSKNYAAKKRAKKCKTAPAHVKMWKIPWAPFTFLSL